MNTTRENRRLSIAWRAAQDLKDGAYVNLGVGIPTDVLRFIPNGIEVVFQSENGILGVGPKANDKQIDRNLVNASQEFVTLQTGACFFDCCDSFSMLRGGHIDVAMLGAYEVAENGDLANWDRGDKRIPPAVGGAMDIVVGTKEIWILMEHCSSKGQPRLVRRTSLPLTGKGVVTRVYTELAVIDVSPAGGIVREIHPGINFERLKKITDWNLSLPPDCLELKIPDFLKGEYCK